MSIWLTVVEPEVPRFTACICDPESVNLGVVSQVTTLSNIGICREPDARTNHNSPANIDSPDIGDLEGANENLRSLTFGHPSASSPPPILLVGPFRWRSLPLDHEFTNLQDGFATLAGVSQT